jgi:NADH-quinone oxidoreductase subunit L
MAFPVIIFLTGRNRLLSAAIAITLMGAAFLLSLMIAVEWLANPITHEYAWSWIKIAGLEIEMGVLLDGISVMMLATVSLVALLVQIYSLGYMRDDPGFSRYFAYLSIFTFSMLGLVIANDFLQFYVFWELVGLCSYLLIGFWFAKPLAAQAAKKAFVTTRGGDFFLLLGILILFLATGSFNFRELAANVSLLPGGAFLALTALLIFMGPVGKSAQFPFHVWLPDAMEGPTPVSALIHAATMVAAGVYLIARTFFLFAASPVAAEIVAYVGGVTAIFAATIALTQFDIKRILAYSTISQLGYMVMALGVGGFTASMFHLMTHAFFKALLFLAAGSVIIGLHHIQDIRQMGGLWRRMPITTATFLVGALALSGIFPFSGFWSKDAILAATLESGHTLLYVVGSFVAFLTALYMFRLFFIAFTGPEGKHRAHETSATMTAPLVVLAVLAVVAGWLGSPWLAKGFGHFVYYGYPHIEVMHWNVALTSSVLALGGIVTAWLIYGIRILGLSAWQASFGPIYQVVRNKYYVDEGIAWLGRHVVEGLAAVLHWHDKHIVDGVVHAVAGFTRWTGVRLRYLQTGNLQVYGMAIFAGTVLLIILAMILMPGLALPSVVAGGAL